MQGQCQAGLRLLLPPGQIRRHRRGPRQNQDASAVKPLIGQLASDDPLVRLAAADTLRSITGENHGYDHAAKRDDRRAAIKRWANWYEQQSASAGDHQGADPVTVTRAGHRTQAPQRPHVSSPAHESSSSVSHTDSASSRTHRARSRWLSTKRSQTSSTTATNASATNRSGCRSGQPTAPASPGCMIHIEDEAKQIDPDSICGRDLDDVKPGRARCPHHQASHGYSRVREERPLRHEAQNVKETRLRSQQPTSRSTHMAESVDLQINWDSRDGTTILSPLGDVDLSRSPMPA